MAQNKNALLRYRTIDRCLRNTGRQWTLQDLVDACSDALYEYEGKNDMVSTRTVQLDIQMMRSNRLGYEAPIEVYNRKYYRYSNPEYSICNRPLSEHDITVINRTIDLLRQFDEFDRFHDMADVVNRLQDKVLIANENRKPIVDFERNPNLKGLEHLNALYDLIASQQTVCFDYQSFNAHHPQQIIIYPYLLKEYRNRWFLFGSKIKNMEIINLAIDRIIDFHPCPDIPYKENTNFSLNFFDDIVGVTKFGGLKKSVILIEANKTAANYILTKPFHKSQKVIENNHEKDTTIFELNVVVNNELITQLLGYGADIRIISPQSLVTRITEIFRHGLAQYE